MGILQGKVAVITGGTSGIGFATARRLAEEGADIALISERSPEQIEQAVQAIRALSAAAQRFAGYRCDVRHRADTKSIAGQVVAQFGRIDILINNAGVYILDAECEREESAFKTMVDVNIHGTYNMILAVLPAMKSNLSGCIVNISSAAAVRGAGSHACYGATKAAILAITHALPQELKGMGIRVVAIGPGAVRTDMTAAVHTPQSAEMERMRASVGALYPSPDPTGDFILDPANIANIAFWLCTDQSWGVNGTMILADHGLSNSWSAQPAGIKSIS
jgi:NAD(P)-dependent dehydrogenase (short-subunit alcohol dehydrogenase family)